MADDVKKEETKKEEVQEAVEAVSEAMEEVAEAQEKVEEAAEAVSEAKEIVEEKPAEVKKEEPVKTSEKKPEPSGKFADLIKTIESMTVLELSELVKVLEDRFGVSAAAPVAVSGAAPAGAGAAAEEEEKAFYNVVITNAGSNKIGVIKAVREVLPDLGLKEAKDLVEAAPATVKENMKKEDAENAKEKLTTAGATVELQ